MTRLFYLSLAAAGLCGTSATVLFFSGSPTLLRSEGPLPRAASTNRTAAIASYPVRIELPPLSNGKIPSHSTGLKASAGSGSTMLGPIRETVATWAFGEPRLAEPAKPVGTSNPAPAISTTARSGLLPAKFDIATFGRTVTDADTEFRARKSLIVGGERVGALELAMGQGSIVSVDRAELARLLGDRAPELSAALARLGTERVTFDTLRTRDIRIRYDALSDAVVIEDRT